MPPELHLLGTRALLVDGRPTDARFLAQPKRLALLAYLAVSRAEGRAWVSRDELVAMFWPESDAAKARKALSQSLWVVASEFDEVEVLGKRGKGDVGVTDVLVCDVGAFLRAAGDGDHETALAHYRGDLLAGFHLSGAPGFQHWLDQCRDRLRARAIESAWALADAAAEDDDAPAARSWARRVLHIASPTDEGALRRVMSFLHRHGDRAGALEAYEAHAAALAGEGDAPLEETERLAAEIRGPERRIADGAGRPSPRRRAVAGVAAGSAPPASPAGGASAPPTGSATIRRRGWTDWAWLIIVAVVVGGHSLVVLLSPDPDPVAAAIVDPGRLLILPFAHRGEAGTEYLETAVVDLLALRLDGIAEFRAVDPAAVFSALADSAWAASPGALQRHFGAGLRLEGSVTGLGESGFEMRARLFDATDSVVADARAAAEDESRVLEAVDQLALGLLGGRLAGLGEPLSSTAALDTRSVEALRSFLRGEAAFRRSDFPAAGELYQEAVRYDSTFALAYFRMSRVGDWTNRGSLMEAGIAGAQAHRDRLPAGARRLLDGYLAFWRGSVSDGLDVLESLAIDQPFDPEARFQLADARFHAYPRLGTPILASAPDFEAALELNPGDRRAMLHLLGLAAYAGDTATARVLSSDLGSGDAAWEFRRRALTGVLPPARPDAALLERMRAVPIGILPGAVLSAADFREDPGLMRAAGERARVEGTSPAIRTEGARLEVLAALASGRLEEADAAILRLAGLDDRAGEEARLYADGLPWTPLPDQVPSAATWLDAPGEHAPLSELLGVHLLLKDGRIEDARLLVDHTARSHPDGGSWIAGAKRLAEALVVEAESGPAEGLAVLESFRRIPGSLGGFGTHPFMPHMVERWHRARMLESLGRDEEALRWYGTVAAPVSYTLAWAAPAHVARARILDRLGRTDEAHEAWRRAGVLWAECSEELLDEATEARLRAAAPGLIRRVPAPPGSRGSDPR